jgi:UDP-glucose 4-epimerase
MKKKKIIVTGGAGYIGSHTVLDLLSNGYEVVVIDNLCESDKENLQAIEKLLSKEIVFYKADLRSRADILDILNDHSDSYGIIHFAALKDVFESVKSPLKYYDNNLTGLINLLECMADTGLTNLIFSSSCSVYGQPDSIPVKENYKAKEILSPYAKTKSICEEIIIDAAAANSLRAVILRYFNPAGAHHSNVIGDNSKNRTKTFISALVNSVLTKGAKMEIFGDDYPTKDGSCIRDFIHVEDLAHTHVLSLSLFERSDLSPVEILNIGSGHGFSLFETIAEMEIILGRKIEYKVVSRRPGDIPAIYADVKKMVDVLKWRPQKNIREILSSTLSWEIERLKSKIEY